MNASGPDMFDLDPWLLGVPNGVVDLRTGALLDVIQNSSLGTKPAFRTILRPSARDGRNRLRKSSKAIPSASASCNALSATALQAL